MRNVLGVIAVTAAFGAGVSPVAAQPAGGAGMATLERMRRAYDGVWYNTLTFVQRTIVQQGANKPDTTTWYESLVGARLRIDMGDPALGNGALFTAETTYVVRNGALVRTNPSGNPFLPLIMGVYLQPVQQTARELALFGFDLSKATAGTWEGKPVSIVGAASPADTASAQFWVDERQLVVRVIGGVKGTGGADVRIGGYERVGRAWLGTRVSIVGPARSQIEEYSDWKVDAPISPQLFDLTAWKTAPHWAPRAVPGPPNQARR